MGEYFYENLKLAREQKGLSQKDVAEKIGVAKSTYSLYESGNREPNVQTIKKIANALDVSADISIHAPTKGATSHPSVSSMELHNFNPRSHEGSDDIPPRPDARHPISIHAPTKQF